MAKRKNKGRRNPNKKGKLKVDKNRKEKKKKIAHIEPSKIVTAYIVYVDKKVNGFFYSFKEAIERAESINDFYDYISLWEIVYTKSFEKIWYNDGKKITINPKFKDFLEKNR